MRADTRLASGHGHRPRESGNSAATAHWRADHRPRRRPCARSPSAAHTHVLRHMPSGFFPSVQRVCRLHGVFAERVL